MTGPDFIDADIGDEGDRWIYARNFDANGDPIGPSCPALPPIRYAKYSEPPEPPAEGEK